MTNDARRSFETKHIVAILVLGSALVRIGLHLSFQIEIQADTVTYISLANRLLEGTYSPVPSTEPERIGWGMDDLYVRPPLFPAMLAAFFLILGKNSLALQMPWLVTSTLTPILTFYLIYKLTGMKWVSVYGAVVSDLFPAAFFWNVQPLPQSTFTLFMLFSFIAWIKKDANPNWLIAFGFSMAAALLTRFEAGLLVPAIFLDLAIKRDFQRWLRIKQTYVALVAFTLVMLPFLLWNYQAFGNPLYTGFDGFLSGRFWATNLLKSGWFVLATYLVFNPVFILLALFGLRKGYRPLIPLLSTPIGQFLVLVFATGSVFSILSLTSSFGPKWFSWTAPVLATVVALGVGPLATKLGNHRLIFHLLMAYSLLHQAIFGFQIVLDYYANFGGYPINFDLDTL